MPLYKRKKQGEKIQLHTYSPETVHCYIWQAEQINTKQADG